MVAASDAVARLRHVSLLTTHRSQPCRQTRGRRRARGLSHRSRLRVLRRQEPLRASPRASRSTDESPSAQIDVVGLRDDNWTDLGECRWGRVRSAPALEAELDRKARLDPNRRGATLGRRCFARRKPASRADANNWYSLQDLYALP